MLHYLKSNPNDVCIDPRRFEFFVYAKMYHHFHRGRLFCNDSVSLSGFVEDDLVPDEMVDNVEEIAKKFGYSTLPILLRQTIGRCDK